ncbi:MAG: bacillithiol biosynthesis cysteine-adding enzyme BshC [Gemmatimonadota bacterium]|nr:bacillithiol biosynthesis cysteine-adding enzyme BshC [Gemmatimonadota bacterium]
MTGLEFETTRLAAPDTLAGRLIAETGPVAFPRARDIEIDLRGARLAVDAFGTSSEDVATKLARVLEGEGLVVSTGQQPVLFTGPLYVLYKALSAIELARALEETLGVPVVPVFWIAADDHDWNEIGQTTMPAADGSLHTLRYAAPDGREARPVGPTTLGPSVEAILDEISQLLPQSEFTSRYLDLLRDSYRPEKTVSEGFAAALRGLTSGLDLAWLDSAHPAVKRASAPFFRRLFEESESVLSACGRGDAVLRGAGFEAPIAPVEGGLPLFYDDGRRRARVIRQQNGDGYAAGRDGDVATAGDWLTRLDEGPERFSANVSSRPPLESWLMPVAATVLGPGEIAYWSQLGPLFETLRVPFPAIRARASFRVVEPRIRKILDRLDIEPQDLVDGGDSVSKRVTAESRPAGVDEALADMREAVSGHATAVEAAVASELPGLNAAAGKMGKALGDAMGQLDRRVDAAVREKQDATLTKVRRAAANLWPRRRPQERVVSPFYLLARYGAGLIDDARVHVAAEMRTFLAGSAEGS